MQRMSYQDWLTGLPPLLDAILHGAIAAQAMQVYADNTYMYGKVFAPMTESTPSSATDRKVGDYEETCKQKIDIRAD